MRPRLRRTRANCFAENLTDFGGRPRGDPVGRSTGKQMMRCQLQPGVGCQLGPSLDALDEPVGFELGENATIFEAKAVLFGQKLEDVRVFLGQIPTPWSCKPPSATLCSGGTRRCRFFFPQPAGRNNAVGNKLQKTSLG